MRSVIFIFIFWFITVLEGRKCYSSAGNSPVTPAVCDAGIDYCIEIDCIMNGMPFSFQGCSNSFNASGNGLPSGCTESGTKTLSATGLTGQYDCCNDKDLCNDKILNPNAVPAADLSTVNTLAPTISDGSTNDGTSSASTATANTSIPTSTTVISSTSNFVERSFSVSVILLFIGAAIYC